VPKAMSKTMLPALLAAAMTGLCVLAAPMPVSAAPQQGVQEQVRPPLPRRADKPPVLWTYAAILVIIVAVAGASTIPSKRGHQD
jgi:hypothetical protein